MKRQNGFEDLMGRTIYKYAKIEEGERIKKLHKRIVKLGETIANMQTYVKTHEDKEFFTCTNCDTSIVLIDETERLDAQPQLDKWVWCTSVDFGPFCRYIICPSCKDSASLTKQEEEDGVCPSCTARSQLTPHQGPSHIILQ